MVVMIEITQRIPVEIVGYEWSIRMYCEVQFPKDLYCNYRRGVLIKKSGEVGFPTSRLAIRLGNDDGYCIRPLKVSLDCTGSSVML